MTYPFDLAQLNPPGCATFPEPDAYQEKIAIRQMQADIVAEQTDTHVGALTLQYPLTDYALDGSAGRALFDQATSRLIAADLAAAVTGYFGTYPYWPDSTVAAGIRRLATGYGNAALRFTAADIDQEQFAQFDAAHPQAIGRDIPTRENVLVSIQALAVSVGAQVFMSPLGKMEIGKIALPPVGEPIEIHPYHMVDQALQLESITEVVAAVKLGYNKNWTVETGLLTAIPDQHKSLFAAEWLTTTKVGASAKDAYRLDEEPTQQDTMLLRQADADPEAQREADLWGEARRVFSFEGFPSMQRLKLGGAIRIFHWRHDLQNGVLGQVIYREPKFENGRVIVKVLV